MPPFDAGPRLAGWFGKLPALGDFAGRRLPEVFTERWDQWLVGGLEASRAALGEQWLDAFLHAPLWHFALMPGLIDEQPWCGVMMPSVDRVGRYFPLTIGAAVALPTSVEELRRLHQWLHALAEAALASLQTGHTVEALEACLAGLPAGAIGTAAARTAADPWPVEGDDFGAAMTTAALDCLWQRCAASSLWWHMGAPLIRRFAGLPQAGDFQSLLAAPARP
jgi:type VI secretion system protein ImpM